MSDKKFNNWNAIRPGLWLIGIGILLLTRYFWPGILIVAGLIMIAEVIYAQHHKPEETPKAADPQAVVEDVSPIEKPDVDPLAENYRNDLLPDLCPACGGPLKGKEIIVEWLSPNTAKCPHCATHISIDA